MPGPSPAAGTAGVSTSRSGPLPIGWSILVNALSVVVMTAATYVTLPLSLHRLGPSAYGTWLLLNSAISFIPLLQAGLPTAAASVLARNMDRDHRLPPEEAAAARTVFSASGGLVLLLAAGAGFLFSWKAPPSDVAPGTLRVASLCIAATLALSIAQQANEAIAVAYERHLARSALHSILAGVRVVSLVAALTVSPTLLSLALSQLGVAVVSYLAFAWLGHRLIATPWHERRWPHRDWIAALGTDSWYVLLLSIGTQLATQVTTLVLGHRFGAAAVPALAVPTALGTMAISLSMAVSAALLPRVSRLAATGGQDAAQALTALLFRLLIILGLVLAFALLAFGESLLAWWISPAFAAAARPYFPCVAASFVLFLPVRSVLFPFELGRGSAGFISWSFALIATAGALGTILMPAAFGAPALAWVSALALLGYSAAMIVRLGRSVLFASGAAQLRFWVSWSGIVAIGLPLADLAHRQLRGSFPSVIPTVIGTCIAATLLLVLLFLGYDARRIGRGLTLR